MKRLLALLAVFSIAVGVAGCSGSSSPQPSLGPLQVGVEDDLFNPKQLTVNQGDTVTWIWRGTHPHNVVGDGFSSEIQSSGQYQHTFDAAGTVTIKCNVHPGMESTIVVQAGAGGGSASPSSSG